MNKKLAFAIVGLFVLAVAASAMVSHDKDARSAQRAAAAQAIVQLENPNLVFSAPLSNPRQTSGDSKGESHVFSRGNELFWDTDVMNTSSEVQVLSHTNTCDRKVTITAKGSSNVLFTYPSACTPYNYTYSIPANQL